MVISSSYSILLGVSMGLIVASMVTVSRLPMHQRYEWHTPLDCGLHSWLLFCSWNDKAEWSHDAHGWTSTAERPVTWCAHIFPKHPRPTADCFVILCLSMLLVDVWIVCSWLLFRPRDVHRWLFTSCDHWPWFTWCTHIFPKRPRLIVVSFFVGWCPASNERNDIASSILRTSCLDVWG